MKNFVYLNYFLHGFGYGTTYLMILINRKYWRRTNYTDCRTFIKYDDSFSNYQRIFNVHHSNFHWQHWPDLFLVSPRSTNISTHLHTCFKDLAPLHHYNAWEHDHFSLHYIRYKCHIITRYQFKKDGQAHICRNIGY